MKGLSECSTYKSDVELLQKLGLNTFQDIPLCKEIKLGTTKISQLIDENIAFVTVFVIGVPAQLWKFEIVLNNEEDSKAQKIIIETGSGYFSEYWKKFYPLFRELASGMIIIKEVTKNE